MIFPLEDLAIPAFRGLLWGALATLGLIVLVALARRWWRPRAARRRPPGDGEINV